MLDGGSAGKRVFTAGPGGRPGDSAYQIWRQQPGNAGKSVSDYLAAQVGATGQPGPAAWAFPLPWAMSLICQAQAPSTVVVYAGETYVCRAPHTAGSSFAADLAAGRWIKVASQGPSAAPANLTMGTVATGAPGSAVAASLSGTGPNYALNLTLPRGAPGIDPLLVQAVLPSLDLVMLAPDCLPSGLLFRLSTGTRVRSAGTLEVVQPGLPRIDHNPTSGAALGCLFEPQATNIVPTSAGVSGAYGHPNAAFTPAAAAGPLGQMTLAKVAVTTAGTAYCQIPYPVPTADGLTRTISGFVRAGNTPTSHIEIQYGGGTFTGVGATIDWTTNTIYGDGSPTLTNYGGGLYRFTISLANTVSGNNTCLFLISPRGANGVNGQQAGDFVYVGDLQVEIGTRATSYIPTYGAAATRAGDVLTVGGADWFNASEGTVFVEFLYDPAKCDPTQYQRLIQASGLDGTFANFYSFTFYPGGQIGLSCSRAGQFVGDFFTFTTASRQIQIGLNRAAFSYSASNGVTVSFNGAVQNTPNVGAVPAFKGLEIGAAAGLYQPNCPISRASYFPRQLPAASLATITGLS